MPLIFLSHLSSNNLHVAGENGIPEKALAAGVDFVQTVRVKVVRDRTGGQGESSVHLIQSRHQVVSGQYIDEMVGEQIPRSGLDDIPGAGHQEMISGFRIERVFQQMNA